MINTSTFDRLQEARNTNRQLSEQLEALNQLAKSITEADNHLENPHRQYPQRSNVTANAWRGNWRNRLSLKKYM